MDTQALIGETNTSSPGFFGSLRTLSMFFDECLSPGTDVKTFLRRVRGAELRDQWYVLHDDLIELLGALLRFTM